MYSCNLDESHAGYQGARRIIIDKFLDFISDKFALDFPYDDDGSEKDHTLKTFLSNMTQIEIYDDYIVYLGDFRKADKSVLGISQKTEKKC